MCYDKYVQDMDNFKFKDIFWEGVARRHFATKGTSGVDGNTLMTFGPLFYSSKLISPWVPQSLGSFVTG
jgi:hypothetical protein